MRKFSFAENKNLFGENLLLYLRCKKIIRRLRTLPCIENLADIGCGYNAENLQKVADYFPKIKKAIGIDLSVNSWFYNSKIRLMNADLNKPLNLEDNSFNAVISTAVLEHIENFELALAEICRILKPEGYLLLTTPSPIAKPILEILSFKLKLLDEDEIRDHKNYFSKQKLKFILKNIGFRDIAIKSFQFGLNNFAVCKK